MATLQTTTISGNLTVNNNTSNNTSAINIITTSEDRVALSIEDPESSEYVGLTQKDVDNMLSGIKMMFGSTTYLCRVKVENNVLLIEQGESI